MAYRRLCNKLFLKTVSAPNGHDYRVTKYGADNDPIASFIGQQQGGEQFDFGKPAASSSGILLNPLHQKIISILAKGNSTQAAGSVPKYTCQGQSKVYNQFIKNGDFEHASNWDASTSTLTVSDNVATFTASAQYGRIMQRYIPLVNGHKYAVFVTFKQSSAHGGTYIMYTKDSNTTIGTSSATTDWQTTQTIFTYSQTTGNGAIVIGDNRSGGWDSTLIKNVMLVDLTAIYHTGNEPATVSAFLADYPFFADYVAYTTGAIHSISSITLGGHTVSVDVRSAGSVYDEWASNSRGTRRLGIIDLGTLNFSYVTLQNGIGWYKSIPGMKTGTIGYLLGTTAYTASTGNGYTLTDMQFKVNGAFIGDSTICFFNNLYQDPGDKNDFIASVNGIWFIYELADYVSFTAGSPLTLASGLTPVDQDGNAVTFTGGTEATPSPNYPVPIVNSSLISITDGQDTNSASIDLAGLTDKDQVYVNVKSTNLFDEVMELGNIDYTTGADGASTTQLRSKNYIPVDAETDYYLAMPGSDNIRLFAYDSEKNYIGSYKIDATWQTGSIVNSESPNNASFTTPQDCAFLRFFTTSSYGTTYNHDISIALYNGSPVPYMPHDTKGKVWKKENTRWYNLGNGTYSYESGGQYFLCTSIARKYGDGLGELCEIFRNVGDKSAIEMLSQPDGVFAPNNNNINIKFKDARYTDPAAFKTAMSGKYIRVPLATPVWTDITSSAMGAALLAMETYEGDSNTATVDNGGQSNVEYWRQV